MQIKRLSKLAIVGFLALLPVAADAASPSLFALSQRSITDELLNYDLTQDPFSSGSGYLANTIAPMDTSVLDPKSLVSIAASKNTLYALSQRPGSVDELLTYDLTQDPFSSGSGYLANTIAPIDTSVLDPASLVSIAVSGNTLYALSQRPGSTDELLTYDLTQDPFSSGSGYLANTIAPIDTSVLDPASLVSIAVSGSTLYALSQRSFTDELLTYDLTQDPFSSGSGYLANTIAPLDTSVLDPESIVSITVNTPPSGGGGSTPVPEPSTYALMMIGMLALAGLKGRSLRAVWSRV